MAKCSRCGSEYYYNQLKKGCLVNFRLKKADVTCQHITDEEVKSTNDMCSNLLMHGMHLCPACSAAFIDWMNGSSVVGNEPERIKKLQSMVKDAATENSKLRDQIVIMRDSESHLMEKVKSSELECSQVTKFNASLRDSLQSARNELKSLKKDYDELYQEALDIRVSNGQLCREKEELKDQVKQLQDRNTGNYTRYVNKIAEYNSLKDQYEQVEKTIDELREKFDEKSKALQEQCSRTAGLAGARELLLKSLQARDNEIEALRDALHDLECEKQELVDDLEKARANDGVHTRYYIMVPHRFPIGATLINLNNIFGDIDGDNF